MKHMDTEGIKKLADLARIDITQEDAAELKGDFESILAYVDQINEVATEETGGEKVLDHRNILRADEEVHEKGIHTDNILNQAPDTKDGYIKVKRILNQ